MLNIVMNMVYIFIVSLIPMIILTTMNIIIVTRKYYIILIIIIFVINYLLFIFGKGYLAIPILSIIISIYLYKILRKLLYAMFISIVIQVIFAFSDLLTGLFFMYIFKLSYSQIIQDKIIYFMTNCTILLASYFISKFVKVGINKLHYINLWRFSKKNTYILLLYITIVFIYMYIYIVMIKYEFNMFENSVIILDLIFIAVSMSSMFIIINLNYVNTKKNMKQEYMKKELNNLKQYMDTLEDLMCDLKKFRHDYINAFILLKDYIEAGNLEDIRRFYKNQLLPECEKIINRNITISMINNIRIDSLKNFIISKILTKNTINIEIKIEIKEKIYEVSMRLPDLCRILGILIDNAIEASNLCNNKFIIFLVLKSEDNVTFIINNSCLENTPPVHKVYEYNFSTKGQGRGHGLNNVKSIINKNYNNVLLNTNIEKCVFKQELIIFNNSTFGVADGVEDPSMPHNDYTAT